MMERITSRKNPLLMKIRRLASGGRRERQAEGEYLGDGIKLLEEALRWSAPLTAAVFADGVEPPDLPKEVRAVQVPGDVMESISPMAAPQGALFLAMGAMAARGDKVAIVEPDYFANRKLAEFFECTIVPVQMRYFEAEHESGLDLRELEEAFRSGVKLFLFSNPNNPTGAVYSDREIRQIAALARAYGVSLIVDELYSRQLFDGRGYTHLCALEEGPEEMVTIIGPSKTESLSGYRLGAAFGSEAVIARMEKLQAIVSLRAAGYCQAVFKVWFAEPEGFMERRILEHQAIRDALVKTFRAVPGVRVRPADAGSYLFVQLPPLDVSIGEFVKIVRRLADVTVTPGTEFGPGFTDSFRINFSQDKTAALAAVDRLLAVMERYRRS